MDNRNHNIMIPTWRLFHEPYQRPKPHIPHGIPAWETSRHPLWFSINTATSPLNLLLSSPWNLHHCCGGALRLLGVSRLPRAVFTVAQEHGNTPPTEGAWQEGYFRPWYKSLFGKKWDHSVGWLLRVGKWPSLRFETEGGGHLYGITERNSYIYIQTGSTMVRLSSVQLGLANQRMAHGTPVWLTPWRGAGAFKLRSTVVDLLRCFLFVFLEAIGGCSNSLGVCYDGWRALLGN